MKKIVVPTDFSECAENALRVAADVARQSKESAIHLVHVYERPISGIALEFYIDNRELNQIREQIHRQMERLVRQDYLDGIEIHKHYIEKKEVWEIPNLKSFKDAELIVMGTHGIKGWQEFFIGSNTQKIVQIAECPVFAIKEHIEKFTINSMVFASNFSSEADLVFVKIKKLATMFGATVHLLRVNTDIHFETTHHSRDMMETFAGKFYLTQYTTNIYYDETVEDGILRFCEKVKPDMIAIETYGRTELVHLLNPGITEHVEKHVWRPVLSVKIKNTTPISPVYRKSEPAP